MNTRLFVEKKEGFRVEAQSLRSELNESLSLKLSGLRLLNVYDLFGFTEELIEKCRYSVFGELVTDDVTDVNPLSEGSSYLAVEFLPGQFDQRASSAVDCVKLIDPEADIRIRSSKLLIFEPALSEAEMAAVKHYYINAVESREKDLSRLSDSEQADVKAIPALDGFLQMKDEDLAPYCKEKGLAMNADDLRTIVEYFTKEGRNPSETELRILDTYWSDHCRHTTFTTELQDIQFEESFIKDDIEGSYKLYLDLREQLGRTQKGLNLMDMACIGARYLRKIGKLDDMEVSEENNACSIFVDVDVDGVTERWLLQFKNETHNHPTEIEPFGGAATCLGGAIRDPLSGRSYVYQAMRVTGAGDIWKEVSEAIPGKLPQKQISRKAAAGYSSYGNQIGLATTHVHEIYHPGYTAKRLEIGAVVGAVKAENVRRESPAPGDVILLLGGRTGRDGIGGATGSSKEHKESSLETCGSEVQKGNAPEERKLQRLFRRPEVTKLIKKSNDFGAGGVSVAIGELADGLDIYLDRVPTKYSGLNSTEIAISESQERMAVVLEAKDRAQFEAYCRSENVEVTYVADVTDRGRMRMFNNGEIVADLSRAFIDTAGAKHYAKVTVSAVEDIDPFAKPCDKPLAERLHALMQDPNVTSQKGLIEMFDSTVGRSTVLMPFGGRLQTTEAQVSVQKLPTDGYTTTASMMAWGYNPFVCSWSPYHGAAYSVVEACAKVVAAGGRYEGMRFSYQEYFERMTQDPHSWGKPMSALLGALKMQIALNLPSIGGKDSMSGTFEKINVPPTLVAFGITPVKTGNVISPEFKKAGNKLYLVKHTPLADRMPDTDQLSRNWIFVEDAIQAGKIVSGWALGEGGLAEALCKSSFGNLMGADVKYCDKALFSYDFGSILVEATEELSYENALYLGEVREDGKLIINGESFCVAQLMEECGMKHDKVYPQTATALKQNIVPGSEVKKEVLKYKGEPVEHPTVFLPVFPGTNCDYDMAKGFRKAGCVTRFGVFCNLDSKAIFDSIDMMVKEIDNAHILAFSGGFSLGDEPDGSAKFIANVINNEKVGAAIHRLLDRGGLIIGICNGFQALVKSGLLPYGRLGHVTTASPTLFRNDINRHISQVASTRISTNASPWLAGLEVGDVYSIAVSHGEGKFVVSDELAAELFANGQVAFQYVDAGDPTMKSPCNPNGSNDAIEGIISPDGQVLGKMGHHERYENDLLKNIHGEKFLPLFENAVKYFRGK
ncbi:MAG: phosphoribosylformylglycinamidine synthase [Bacteroidales bacterium]|nr:phosphoribosylformylglycinamidine synthase [Candidatus Cryptobacteroides caccocaballi]